MFSPSKTVCAALLCVSLAACAGRNGYPDVGALAGAAEAVAAGNVIGGAEIATQMLGTLTGGAGGMVPAGGAGDTLATAAGGIVSGGANGTAAQARVADGSDLATLLDNYDRQQMSSALENNPDQQTSSWKNPKSNEQGSLTPTRTYYVGNNTPYRNFTVSITANGQTWIGRGTASRAQYGTWYTSIHSSAPQQFAMSEECKDELAREINTHESMSKACDEEQDREQASQDYPDDPARGVREYEARQAWMAEMNAVQEENWRKEREREVAQGEGNWQKKHSAAIEKWVEYTGNRSNEPQPDELLCDYVKRVTVYYGTRCASNNRCQHIRDTFERNACEDANDRDAAAC